MRNGRLVRRSHPIPLFKGKRPTADELIQEMAESKQMQVEMLGWNVRQIPLPLSEEKYFVCADWVKESVSTEEILKTVGASEQDLREIEALSTLVVPESVEKVFSTLIEDASPSRKNRGLGRNQKCSCGSGKKVKHCCGTR
jgi:hypothetical protein